MTAQPPYPGVSDDNLLARLKCRSNNCVQITSNVSFIGSASDTFSKSLWYKVYSQHCLARLRNALIIIVCYVMALFL